MNIQNTIAAIFSLLLLLLSSAFLAPPVCRADDGQTSQYPPQLLKFSAAKEQQVRTLARDLNIKVPPEVSEFFKAAARGDFAAVTNTIIRLAPEYWASYKMPAGDQPAWIPLWQPMTEVQGAYIPFATGGTKYPLAFGNGIMQSIPAGSIYFGGTPDGRDLVTALCEAPAQGKPFYTLTQRALTDGRYLDYLRTMYGRQIHLPTTNEVQNAIDAYKADALLRLKHDQEFPNAPRQIKPGEDVRLVNGEVQVSGWVSLMAVNARVAKLILDRNPKPDFYLEENFPMDWTYPHLSPHGLIFKLNHEPLKALTPAMLDADHAFWTKQCQSMLGDWLKPDTSLSNVCHFAEAVYGRKDWSGFSGDKGYVTNEFATKTFARLRGSIAGLYQWRLTNKMEADDAARLRAEADYALRQAYALCPTDKVVIHRCLSFLMEQGRGGDAIVLLNTARKLDPDDQQLKEVLAAVRENRVLPKASKFP